MISSWKQSFEENSRLFERSFGHLTASELNWKPDESAWSVGQVIEHLIRINESYYPVLGQLKTGHNPAPWIANIGFIPKLFAKFILAGVDPERQKKIKTFPLWEPSYTTIPEDIVGRFISHHRDMINKLDTFRDLFGKGIIISSPAKRYVVYPLDTAIDILILHEKRHYNQAMEVVALQKGTQF